MSKHTPAMDKQVLDVLAALKKSAHAHYDGTHSGRMAEEHANEAMNNAAKLFAALIARNAALEADNRALREAVKLAKPYIATHVTACHGEKCRELNCESCFSDAHENAENGRKALEAIARAEAGHG